MSVKVRLARHGSKRKPFYHIVIADSRAPRDGKYIERIGSYNPTNHPATIDLDFDKALDWVQKGAIPTETCKTILSSRGVLMKKHLLEGVKKGAFSEEDAESRFVTWVKDKEIKDNAQLKKINDSKDQDLKKILDAEGKINEDRKAIIAKRKLADIEAQAAEVKAKQAANEEAAEAVKAEEKPAEEPKVEAAKAEEKPAEEPKAEAAKTEAPVVEAKAEEAKVEAPVVEAKVEAAKEEKAPAAEAKAEEAKEEKKAE